MDPITGMLIGTAISTITGFLGSKKSEKAAERQAREQAVAEAEVTAESLYRSRVDQRTAFGETLAGYASGGVRVAPGSLDGSTITAPTVPEAPQAANLPGKGQGRKAAIKDYLAAVGSTPVRGGRGSVVGGGSVGAVLAEQSRAFEREREITSRVGATRVSQALQEGRDVAKAYRYSGYANVASSISSMFTNYALMKP